MRDGSGETTPELPIWTRKLTTFDAFPALGAYPARRPGRVHCAGKDLPPGPVSMTDATSSTPIGPGGHLHLRHGDVRAVVPARRGLDLEGGRGTMGRDGRTEQDGDGFQAASGS